MRSTGSSSSSLSAVVAAGGRFDGAMMKQFDVNVGERGASERVLANSIERRNSLGAYTRSGKGTQWVHDFQQSPL